MPPGHPARTPCAIPRRRRSQAIGLQSPHAGRGAPDGAGTRKLLHEWAHFGSPSRLASNEASKARVRRYDRGADGSPGARNQRSVPTNAWATRPTATPNAKRVAVARHPWSVPVASSAIDPSTVGVGAGIGAVIRRRPHPWRRASRRAQDRGGPRQQGPRGVPATRRLAPLRRARGRVPAGRAQGRPASPTL